MIEKFLKILKDNIENHTDLNKEFTESKGENNGFEKLVKKIIHDIKDNSHNYEFTIDYETHFGHHFPDLDIFINNKKYGIELKSRNTLTWTTNGNSIFESITDEGYENIYLLFGALDKKNNSFQVKYEQYWKVLSDIKVTHSPRFFIDMNLPEEERIFTSNREYTQLREYTKEQKNQFVSNKLRQKTNESQWYLPSEETIEPILFSTLNDCEKNRIIAISFILFAHDLLRTDSSQNPHAYYDNITAYIFSQYYCYSSSFRDLFSAGGRYHFKEQDYPKSFGQLTKYFLEIKHILSKENESLREKCYLHWQQYIPDVSIMQKDLLSLYYIYLDRIGEIYHSKVLGTKKLSELIINMNNSIG